MTEETYSTLSEAIAAISNIKLNPEDGLKFVSILSAWYGVAPTPEIQTPVKKRGASKDLRSVSFGGHLKDLVKDTPKTPTELLEPLRERGVRLANSNEYAIRQIIKGFQKSKETYRQYPEGKWGLLTYAPPRLIAGKD